MPTNNQRAHPRKQPANSAKPPVPIAKGVAGVMAVSSTAAAVYGLYADKRIAILAFIGMVFAIVMLLVIARAAKAISETGQRSIFWESLAKLLVAFIVIYFIVLACSLFPALYKWLASTGLEHPTVIEFKDTVITNHTSLPVKTSVPGIMRENDDARFGIDDLLRLPIEGGDLKRDYLFDVVLRNGTESPVNVTHMEFSFDPPLIQRSASMAVSATYDITIVSDRFSIAEGPHGPFPTRSYYDPNNRPMLVVSTPCRQALGPKTSDRFQIKLKIDPKFRLEGPMKAMNLELEYNDGKRAATSIPLLQ
jgi:hypothetical protein